MKKLTVLSIFASLIVVPAMAQGYGRQSDSPTRNNPNFTGGAQPYRGYGGRHDFYGRGYGYGGRHYGPFEHMHRRERFERRFFDRY